MDQSYGINVRVAFLVMAKTYLSAQDPRMITRTWTDVLARFCDRSNANTRMRHERVVRTNPAHAQCVIVEGLQKGDGRV